MKTTIHIVVIVLVLIGSVVMATENDPLWGPIDMGMWKNTPCIEGRVATKEDVKKGLAVFYIENSDDIKPINIHLPACAIHIDQETKKETPVILIQAEKSQGQELIGYRFLNGGNGIALLFELKLIDKPDERFH
jgi:hypothetical protein